MSDKMTFTFSPEIMEQARQKVREHARIQVRSDTGFKLQLSNNTKASNHCLRKLLSALTGKTVTKVQVLNAEITPEYFTAKRPRLDVYCTFNDGQKADIELQLSKESDLESKRAVYYASKLYAGNLKKGELYSQIKNIYQIFLTSFKVFDDDKLVHNFQLYDGSGIRLTDSFQVIFAELSKTKSLENRDFRTLNPLEFWCILYTYDRNSEVYQKLRTVEAFREDLQMFEESIDEISQEEKDWAMQLSIDGGVIDYDTAMDYAERRGKTAAKLEDAVIAVRKFNIPVETVAKEYGIPVEDLTLALQNNSK